MSNVGQGILTIAGTIIGAYYGNPQLGYLAGSLLGQALFPTKLPGQQGPRLSDARTTTSEVGAPVMIVRGTDAVPGNVIWLSKTREVSSSKKVGGKGGPQQKQTTYTYYQSIAIGLCKGPKEQILRVWENGKVVYDIRAKFEGETDSEYTARVTFSSVYGAKFVFYTGHETQLPDPTIELDKGVGNVPAFRGLCYVVYPDRQLREDQGMRHPNFRFEISDGFGTPAMDIEQVGAANGYTNIAIGTDPTLTHTLAPPDDPVSPNGAMIMVATTVGSKTSAGAFHPPEVVTIGYGGKQMTQLHEYYCEQLSAVPFGTTVKQTRVSIWAMIYNVDELTNETVSLDHSDESASILTTAFFFRYVHPLDVTDPLSQGAQDVRDQTVHPLALGQWSIDTPDGAMTMSVMTSTHIGNPPEDIHPTGGLYAEMDIIGTAQWNTYHRSCFIFRTVYSGVDRTDNYGASLNPNDPTRPYSLSAFQFSWRAAPASGNAVDCIPLSEVVQSICNSAGLLDSDIDVTDLEDICIRGYTTTRVMACNDELEPLRFVGYFDMIDTGQLLRFRVRGQPVDKYLTTDDLGAFDVGAEPNAKVKTTVALEKDLPRIIRLHYKAHTRDYEPGEQISPARSTTEARNDLDLELCVAINDTQAAQIAEVLWSDAWEGRTKHEINLDSAFVEVLPGDVLEIPVDGFTERVRVAEMDETLPLLRRLITIRDFAGSYVSAAIAAPPERLPVTVLVIFPSKLIIMDIPALRVADNDIGVYATIIPTDSANAWRAAVVYRSNDDEASFSEAGSVTEEPTMGTVVIPLDAGITSTWDDSQVLTVDLLYGTLENRPENEVLTGANAIAVGANGRWEIVQFTTITQISANRYELSHLLRGRRGTEHLTAGGLAGDQFVLISGEGVLRMAVPVADYGRQYTYKTITFGLDYNDGTDQTNTTAGVAMKPFSPVLIAVEVLGVQRWRATWIRRDRLYQTLQGGVLPLSEASERYEVEVFAGAEILDSAFVTEPLYLLVPFTFQHNLDTWIMRAQTDGASDVLGLNQAVSAASIRRFDAASGTATGSMALGATATGLVVVGAYAYASAINGASASVVYRIALSAIVPSSSLTFTHDYPQGAGEFQGLSTDGLELFASKTYAGEIKFLSLADLSVLDTLAVAGAPAAQAVDAGTLYVCCRGSSEISIVDIATRTETSRFACVTSPLDIVVTPLLVFVMGTSQLGIYTHAGVEVDTVPNSQSFSAGPLVQYLAYDDLRVMAIDGAVTPVVRFYNRSTGVEEKVKNLGITHVGGFSDGRYYFRAASGIGKVYDGSLPDGYGVRVYQLSAVVGRGTVGVLQT